jgi:hypothetical protein
MGLRLPDLVRPRWVTAMATVVGCALSIGITAFLMATVAFFVMCAVAYLIYQGTKPLAVAFRPEFATVGGLTKSILRRNYGAISDECQRANAEDVWRTLRTLIAEHLGVHEDNVTKAASFVKDLNVG